MSFGVRATFELRPAGNSLNGGFFDPSVSVPGTDYSQQSAAQVSRTDMVIGASSTITSAAIPFTSAEVGNGLHVGSGTGWTPGFYTILSISGSTVTVLGSPGTIGSTGGTGRVGGALSGFADLPALVNNVVWFTGTFSTAVQIILTAGSGDGGYNVYLGYGASRGDNIRATITTGAVLAPIIAPANQIIFRGAVIDGTNTAQRGMDCGFNCHVDNVKAVNCLFSGIRAQNAGSRVRRCLLTACGDGVDVATGSTASECEATLCNNGGRSSNSGGNFEDCLFHHNVSNGFFQQGSGGARLKNCVMDANGVDGLRINDSFGIVNLEVIDCEFTNNTGAGIKSVTTDYSGAAFAQLAAFFQTNAFFNNGGGNYVGVPAGASDILLSQNPYTNAAGGDYSRNDTAGGGALLRGTGLPGGYGLIGSGASATVGRRDIGVQTAATAAGVTSGGVFGQAPVFDQVQMDPEISRGAVYGPSYSTIVVTSASGTEQRVAQWSVGRYKGTISKEVLIPPKTAALVAFFHARLGKLRAFRFKDWNDYTATNETLSPTGAPTVQLQKTYSSGPVSFLRPIYAPVASPAPTLRKNGASFLGFTLDTSTGLVTLTALIAKSITAITQASSAVVTVGAAHGFASGDLIFFSGIVGMTALNGQVGLVTATAATTVTVAVNTTQMAAYTSGGTAAKYLTILDTLDATYQFDNVVRFDQDEMPLEMSEVSYQAWNQINLIEVR